MPRHFRFNVLWLISEEEARARKITWAKNTTVLVGGNHTGKSTLLRMLYHAFGCKTRPLGREWNPRTVVAVTFTVDDQQLTILRRGPAFSLFDDAGVMLWATEDQGDLRARFSSLVPFVLPLVSQRGDSKQARPAFFFVPLFIDQDGSWGNSWNTFDGLREFRDWQKATIDLMLGISSSEFWKTFADLQSAKTKVEDLAREKKILEDTRKRLSEKFPKVPWFRDALAFRRELSSLETRASSLAKQQQQLEAGHLDSLNAQNTLTSQMAMIESALLEHSADMQFLDERRGNGEIICPTCGTSHEHSFHSRLNLEAEADDLRQLRAHFRIKLERVQSQVSDESEDRNEIAKKTNEIEKLLESHRGELKLREIVDRAGANTAHEALDEQAHSVIRELVGAEQLTEALKEKLEQLRNPTRAKEITRRFREFYSHFAGLLDVPGSLLAHNGQVQRKPSAGGSGGPRAVLAYYFSLAHTAEEFSVGCLPPMAVDSPHQQAQDEINRPQVTEFIFKNRPAEQQLIVGLEDAPPQTVVLGSDDKRIDLNEKFKLLAETDYDEVFSFIGPKWRAANASIMSSKETDPDA
jgi:hypothetical protein